MSGSMLIISTIATPGRIMPKRCSATSSTGSSSARISTARASPAPTRRRGRSPRPDSAPANSPGGSSGLQPVAGPEHPPDDGEAQEEEAQGRGEAEPDADIGGRVEAPAEALDQIDDRVEVGDRPPRLAQHRDRIESAAEEGERGHDQHRDELDLLEILPPDADDEAEQAEGDRDQDQEGRHPQRMIDADRHEEGGGGKDDEAEHDRFGRRRADIADHRLERRDRRREQLVDGAGELGDEDAEAGVEDALGEQRQHDQAGHDEGAIGHAAGRILLDVAADRRAEHNEIERGGDHRRDQALPERAQRSRHFEAVDRPGAVEVEVHAASLRWTRLTKMSSSELCRVWRSLKPMPESLIARSSDGTPVFSALASNT